jgi:MSHA biogenesis protein MshL
MNHRSRSTLILACALALATAGCAARRADPAYRTGVATLEPAVNPAPRADTALRSSLPPLPVAPQIIESAGGARRIQRLDAVDQDVRALVRGLAESFNVSYEIDPEVQGTVTARLQGASLEEALAIVLPARGYSYSFQNGVLRVGVARYQTRMFAMDYIALSRVGTGSTVIQRRLTGVGTTGVQGGGAQPGGFGGGQFGGGDAITSVSAADLWEDMRVALEGLVFDAPAVATAGTTAPGGAVQPGGVGQRASGAFSRVDSDGRRLIINPIAGTVLVTAPAEKLAEVETFIRTFETSVQRQVLIEAKIVEVNLDRGAEFGIDWNTVQRVGRTSLEVGQTSPATIGAGGVQITLGGGGPQITAVLRALETQGDVRVLSSPRVSALNNQRAIFNVTTDEVFFAVTRQPIIGPTGGTVGFNTSVQPQQIAVGIVLDVLPQVGPDNTITMNIRPVVTNVARVESITLDDGTTARAPVIDRRETDTVVRVRGGETIVIGGLMQSRREKTRSGIPILRHIPGIGRLFSSERDIEHRGELVIFLTPTIVAGTAPS